ncbi:hypothetical protein [Marinicella gelatinilytica]|uniref:hypothetical protein n=1 Tax=Marinicella gelatinilytica TaxID=2996017 RepID=UPI002260CCFC|nr:hypothetical protein [Marinicella gelatinilytica]MCX7546088.1 hypothetical protein [Marinicella gelatinilytica]
MTKLINCKACSNKVSSNAKTCPKCGNPIKQTSVVTWIIGGMFAIALGLMIFIDDNPKTSTSNNTPTTKTVKSKFNVPDKSIEAQNKRKEFIQKLINDGYIHKVEMPGSLPHVFVKTKFYDLSFDDKQSFLSMILAYYFVDNNNSDILVIKDYKSGKNVGQYSERGLKLN